jgi:hypothetical protein
MNTRLTASLLFIASLATAPAAVAFQDPLETTVQPSQRFDERDLVLTGPADHPAFAVIGPTIPQRRIGRGVWLDVAPHELLPFTFDAEGNARVAVGADERRTSAHVQVIVMNKERDGAVTIFPPRSLNASATGYTVSGAAANSAPGALGGEVECTTYCAPCEDMPDEEYRDTNCDGIDGDVARALFVDEFGVTGGVGTMSSPMTDLQLAIDTAYATPGVDHVYVSIGLYQGPIDLADGVSIWGGYDANNGWSRDPSNVAFIHNLDVVNSPEGISALRGSYITQPTVVADLRVEAWGAGALLGGDGDHAFGIHLHQVSGLRLERVRATGAFADWGLIGASVGNVSGIKLGGGGGSGGTSGSPTGGIGSSGNGTSCSAGGLGGLGGLPYFGGFNGVIGSPGIPGGWGSSSFGSISISGPYLNMSGNGTGGSDGCRGGGGGGGGGGGYALFVGNGGKGGKGGNGGYAGRGAKGGKRAGCSVGLFLSSSTIEAVDCTFSGDVAGVGGAAGAPGSGTAGNSGSDGQSVSGPDGGDGGEGGPGGIGGFAGPGASGHSYGILASSDSSANLSGTTVQATVPGIAMIGFVIGHAGEAVPFKQL